MKIGLMTGGGDAPGLNGIIESVSRTLIKSNCRVYGVRRGFEGIFEKDVIEISYSDIKGRHTESGTFLGTSNRSGINGREKEFVKAYQELGFDGLIVAGGDGTFRGLQRVQGDVKVIGVPKTIDNDLPGTEITFGYDTACACVAESVDALWHTAEAHRRVFFVEAMGRDACWIALGGGLSSYADMILIPERPFSREVLLQEILNRRKEKEAMMVVVSEGAHAEGESPNVALMVKGSPQEERYGGIAERLARWTEKETGWESRHVVLGHLQRSHAPTTTDRFLTMGMGVQAARLAIEQNWNKAVVYRNGRIHFAPITDIMGDARCVPEGHRWVELAKSLGIYI